jgi:HK97 family phage portal protein
MGILDRLGLRRLPQPEPEQKALPLIGSAPYFFGSQIGLPDLDTLTRATAYAYSAYIYAAMQYRANKISEPPLWVAQETEDGEEWLRDHPLAPLLDNPSPDFDMGALRAATSMFLDIDGEAVWHLMRDAGGRVARIYPYQREKFEVASGTTAAGDQRLYARFRIQHDAGARIYGPEDVVYFRDPSPYLTGAVSSRLDVCLKWANLGEQVERGIRTAMTRGVMPFVVFSYPPEYNPDSETRERNREMLEQRYGGVANHGRPLTMYGGLKAEFANVDLANLLPEVVLDRVEANVALAFGVRPEVLGMMVGLKNSPWSHMETARRIVYEDTIEPFWRREEKALSRQLLGSEDIAAKRYIRVDTSGIRALQADELQKAQISTANANIWTVDERRIYTGKDPLPIEEEAATAAATLNGAQITAAILVLQSLRSAEPSERISAIGAVELLVGIGIDRERAQAMVAAAPIKAAPQPSMPNEAKDGMRALTWIEHDLHAKAQEDRWKRAVLALLGEQSADILRLAEKYLSGTTAPTIEQIAAFLTDVQDYLTAEGKAKAEAALRSVVKLTGETAAQRLASRLSVSFDVIQPGLDRYLANELNFLTSVMGDTTGEAVARTMQQALGDQVPYLEIRDRLERLPAFSPERAELVARTETTRASNGAQMSVAEGYQQETGRVMEKTWISSRDSRVREEHAGHDDGQWYPLDHQWGSDGEKPSTFNCRCTLGYRFAPEPRRLDA